MGQVVWLAWKLEGAIEEEVHMQDSKNVKQKRRTDIEQP